MDRRSFLKTSALGGSAAAASTLAAPAYAAGKRVLTMVQSWPRGFAALDDASSYYAKMIGEMSDGALTVDKKAPGELVGALEVFDAVSSGQADMYHSADYYFIGQHPGYAYFTADLLVAPHRNSPIGTTMVVGRSCMTNWARFSISKGSLQVIPGHSRVAGFAKRLIQPMISMA